MIEQKRHFLEATNNAEGLLISRVPEGVELIALFGKCRVHGHEVVKSHTFPLEMVREKLATAGSESVVPYVGSTWLHSERCRIRLVDFLGRKEVEIYFRDPNPCEHIDLIMVDRAAFMELFEMVTA